MTLRHARLLLSALLLIVAPAARAVSPAVDLSPTQRAQAFYHAVRDAKVVGIPDRKAQARIAPHATTALRKALHDADEAERRHREATRDTEPPLWEGNPFSSLFEGFAHVEIERCRREGDRAECVAALDFKDPRSKVVERWNDRVRLVREDGRWLVDDIAYGGRWDFANKGTLREGLASVAAWQPEKEAVPAGRK